jgi:hypothetical protein
MSVGIRKLTRQAGEWLWQQRYNRLYSPRAGLRGDPEALRLLLGPRSAGLDWLAALLGRSAPRIRYYNEPLRRYTPPLLLSNGPDRCAIGFSKTLPERHPLLRVLRMLVEPDNVWATERMSNRVPQARYEPDVCLVKETRGLLAAEPLLRGFGSPAVLLVVEPLSTVDQILHSDGLQSGYLEREEATVLRPAFVARFMPRDSRQVLAAARTVRSLPHPRERRILGRVLTVGLINRMFRMLDARYPCATAVSLRQLSHSPRDLARLVVGLLGEGWRDSAEIQVAEACTSVAGRGLEHGQVPVAGLNEPLRFLTVREALTGRDMLAECGLAEVDTDELLTQGLGISVFPHHRQRRSSATPRRAASHA